MIIGLTGLAFSGKDTIGRYLVENYGFERRAFADKLKDSVAALFNITRDEIDAMKYDIEVPTGGKKPGAVVTLSRYTVQGMIRESWTWREFLQLYGTESHREIFGNDFWVEQLFKETPWPEKVVITDVRFESEVHAICKLGGRIVKIHRDGVVPVNTHASEIGVHESGISAHIYNEGTLDDLYRRVDMLMGGMNVVR